LKAWRKKQGRILNSVIKGYRGITHDPFDDRLGEKKPTLKEVKINIKKIQILSRAIEDQDKLGARASQFPVFFHPSSKGNGLSS